MTKVYYIIVIIQKIITLTIFIYINKTQMLSQSPTMANRFFPTFQQQQTSQLSIEQYQQWLSTINQLSVEDQKLSSARPSRNNNHKYSNSSNNSNSDKKYFNQEKEQLKYRKMYEKYQQEDIHVVNQYFISTNKENISNNHSSHSYIKFNKKAIVNQQVIDSKYTAKLEIFQQLRLSKLFQAWKTVSFNRDNLPALSAVNQIQLQSAKAISSINGKMQQFYKKEQHNIAGKKYIGHFLSLAHIYYRQIRLKAIYIEEIRKFRQFRSFIKQMRHYIKIAQDKENDEAKQLGGSIKFKSVLKRLKENKIYQNSIKLSSLVYCLKLQQKAWKALQFNKK